MRSAKALALALLVLALSLGACGLQDFCVDIGKGCSTPSPQEPEKEEP